MKDRIFIDPTPITPRELAKDEMGQIYGGVADLAAPAVVIWVAECNYGLGGVISGGVITVSATTQ